MKKTLDNRLVSDFTKYCNKNYSNALDDLLPKKLIPVIIKLSGVSPECKVHDITREQRRSVLELLKSFTLTVTRLRPIEEAIITSGGVNTKEISPKTMESKLVTGLYFAGNWLTLMRIPADLIFRLLFLPQFVLLNRRFCRIETDNPGILLLFKYILYKTELINSDIIKEKSSDGYHLILRCRMAAEWRLL